MDFVLILGCTTSVFVAGAARPSPVTETFAFNELVMDQNNSNSEQKCVEVHSDLLSRENDVSISCTQAQEEQNDVLFSLKP